MHEKQFAVGWIKLEFWVKQLLSVLPRATLLIWWLILGQYRDNCCGCVLTRAFVCLPGYEWNCRVGGDLSRFRGSGGCANCLPNVVSPGSLSALGRVCHHIRGCWMRQAPPWASHREEPCQFSVSWAAFQTGRSEDLLKYHLLAFFLVSELFVALTDMKITYQRGMTLLLSKKSGFHLSSERAVMMTGFFPITYLNFSCAVVFKCRAGDLQTMQRTAGGSLFLCSALHQWDWLTAPRALKQTSNIT